MLTISTPKDTRPPSTPNCPPVKISFPLAILSNIEPLHKTYKKL